MKLRALLASVVLLGFAAGACGDDDAEVVDAPDAAAPRPDGGPTSLGEVPPVVPGVNYDDVPEVGDPVPDNPSVNNYPDASFDDDDGGVTRPRGCLELEPGEELTVQGELTAERSWRRIEAGTCPVMTLSALTVPFQPFELCPSSSERTLEIVMRGADMFEGEADAAVLDPLLVVYPTLDYLTPRPFECLASNEDGIFDGLENNSSRIQDLRLPAYEPAVIIASSRDEASQRGAGLFSLTVRAR